VLISYLDDEENEDAHDTAMYGQKAGQKAVLMKGEICQE